MKCVETRYQEIQLTLELIYFTIYFRFYCLQNYFNILYIQHKLLFIISY